jgi:hypothetical protein
MRRLCQQKLGLEEGILFEETGGEFEFEIWRVDGGSSGVFVEILKVSGEVLI